MWPETDVQVTGMGTYVTRRDSLESRRRKGDHGGPQRSVWTWSGTQKPSWGTDTPKSGILYFPTLLSQ